MFTTEVENFPGFPNGVMGPQLMQALREQAERFGTQFIRDDVVSVKLDERPFVIQGGEETVQAHALIVATGARANWLNLENEQRLAKTGGGVSACAVWTARCRSTATRCSRSSAAATPRSKKAAT